MSSTKAHNKTQITLFIFLALYFSIFTAHAAVFTSSQNGNWNVSATWGGAGVPGASDEVVISVGHTVTLVANTSISGAATINGTLDMATFNFTSGSLIGSGSVTASGSPVLTTGGLNSTTTFSGTLGTGSFSLVVNGTGSLTLSGSNSFTGGITLNSTARLNINHTDALGTGALTLAGAGCRIDNTSGADLTLATNNVVNVNNSFTFLGTHNLTFGTGDVVFTTSRTITLSANSLRFNGQGIGNVSADYIITATGVGTTLAFNGFAITTSGATSRILTLTGTANILVSGAITNGTSSSSSLTYTGTGSLTLSASNSFSGGITHNSTGKLNINHTNALGSGALTLSGANCVIDNTSGADLTLATNNVVNVNNNFTFTGTHNLTFGTGNVVFGTSRNITISANTLSFNGQAQGNVSADYTITVNGAGTTIAFNGFAITTSGATSRILTLAGTSNILVSGAITNGTSSNSSLTYNGSGSLTLTASNTYTGTTTHSGTGKLNINHSNALSTGALTLSGGNCVIDNTSGAPLTLATNNQVNVNANFTFTGTHNLTFGTGNVIFNASHTITLNANTLRFNGQGRGNVTANYIITVNGPGNTVEFNGFAIVSPSTSSRLVTFNGTGDIVMNAAVTNGTASACLMTYSGTGTLQLLAAVTYTGATTITSGTCILGATNGLSTSSAITVNGTLDVNGFSQTFANLTGATGTITTSMVGSFTLTLTNSSSGTYNGVIDEGSATFEIIKTGTAALTLGGANAYSGLTTVSAGTIIVTHSSALGNLTGATTVASGAVLSISGGITLADNITLAGTGISSGGALINASGVNTITGDITYTTASRITSTAGTLTLGNLSATNLAMVLIGAGGIVIDGVVNIGNATLTLSASVGSSLTLNSANTINNGLVLAASSHLNIGHAGALGTGAITLLGTIDNARLEPLTLTTNNAFTVTTTGFTFAGSNNLNLGTGAVTLSASQTIIVNGTSSILTFGGTATNSAAANISVTANGAGNTLTFTNFNISNSATTRTVTFQGTGNIIVNGIIANGGTATAGSVIKAGTGILELRGTNSYHGDLTINAGIVRTFTINAFGDPTHASTVTVASGASLEVNNHNFFTTKFLTLNGNGVNDSGALRIMSGTCLIHTVTLSSASRIQVESGATYSANSNISGTFPLTLHIDGSMSLTPIGGSITTGSTVLKSGTGTLLYSAIQTHTDITVANGRFELDIANAIPATAGITVNSPGIVDMNGRSQSIKFIAGNGTITNEGLIATATLTLNNIGGETQDYSGTLLQGTATRINLTKAAGGTQILSGNNTYNGLTTVSAGALRVSHNNALGAVNAGTTVSSGGALELIGNITISDTLTVSGTGVSNGGAIRNMGGDNTIVPPVTSFANSRINSNAGTLIFASTATYNAATRDILFGGAGNITYSAPINITTHSLTKDGTGVLILGGNNSYTGATTISAGTIRLQHVRGIPPLSALTVSTSATFDINGFSPIIGSLAATPSSAVITSSSPGDLLLTVGTLNTSTAYAGSIQNGSATSISLRKIGTGTLTLSNTSSSYSGTTVISNGNLSLTGAVAATGNSPIGTNTSGVILGDTGTTAINASPILAINSITIARNVTVADQPTTGTYTITNNAASGSATLSGQILLNQPVTIGAATRPTNINGGITSANAGEKRVTFNAVAAISVSTNLITDGSGKLNILKTGTGLLTLNALLHTFSGTVTINAGTLQANDIANAGSASSIGTGSPADTIYINGGATFIIGTTISDATNRTIAITGNGAIISTNSVGVPYTLNGSIVGNFSSIFSYNTSTIAIGGVVSCGAITKAGSGILRLDNTSNNYTGSTTVSAGTLRLGASGVIPDGSALINNATFELNGFNETLGSIVGTGTIRNGSAATVSTLTCGGDNTSTTYSGIIINGNITRALNLVKEGSGTLTLNNLNTYTGTTTINGGILKAAGMSVFGSNSAFTLADVAGVAIDITAFDHTIGSLAGGGSLGGNVILGAAVLTTGGNNTTTTFSGSISGAGDLTKAGTGEFTLSGINTYLGITTVSAGTLKAGVALNLTGGLSLATGSTFNCNNVTSTAGFLLLNGTGQVPNTYGSTASAATIQNNTFFTAASTGILDVTGGLSAGYWTGATSTNWHTASNWQGNVVPDATTDVFIQSGPANQPVIGSSAEAKDVTIFAGATLSITGTNTMTVSGNWNNHGTFTPNNSTVVFDAATLQDAYNGTNSFFNIEHSGSGTLEILTNNVNPFTVTNELLQSGGGIIDLNSKNMNIGTLVGNGTIRTSAAERDTLTISGSITASGDYSGVIENGVGTLSIIRSGTGIVAFSGNNSFTGGVRISGGTLVAAHANALGLDTVFFSGGTLRCRSNSALNFNRPCFATANTTINIDRETAGSGVTYTFGTLRINSTATLTLSGGNNVNAGTAGITFGNMTYAAAPTFTVNNPSLGGNTLFTFGAVSGAFTAIFNGNGDAIQTGRYETGTGGITYSGTGNLFLNRQNTFTGILTINSGNVTGSDSTQAFGAGSITMTGGRLTLLNDANIAFSRAVTYSGNIEIMLERITPGPSRMFNMGNLTCTSGNLTLLNGTNNTSGTPIVVFITTQLSAATIFDVATDARLQLTVLNGNNSMTKNGNGELRITGSSTGRNGGLTAPNILNAGRLALLNAAALASADTANLTMNGGILDLMADAGTDFNVRPIINSNAEIQVNRVSAGGALTHTVRALTIGNDTLTVANGSNITSGVSTLTVNGLFNLSGNATFNAVCAVNLNGIASGTGSLTKTGPEVIFQNSSNPFTLPAAFTISQGSIVINSPNFTVTGLTTVSAGTLNLNGTTNNFSGGFTVNGGTISTLTTSTHNITGDFIQTSGTFIPGTSTTVSVTGNYTRNGGTYTANGTLRMNGTTQQVSGSVNPITMPNFVVATGSTTTLAQNIRMTAANLTIQPGATLDASTFTLNRSAAGGVLTIAGTLRLAGNTGGVSGSNFPNSYSIQTLTNGTVIYERLTGGQTVASTPTYSNLVIGNTSGIQIVGGNTTVNTTLTTTAGGTLNMGSSRLLGTLTTATHNGTLRTQNTSTLPFPTGVDFTNAGATGTIVFDGLGNQAIPANTTCFNMTLSNGNQTQLQGNATVNGTLSFVSGTCNLNGQFLSVNNLSGHSAINEFISSPSASLTLRGTVGNLFFNQSIQGQTNAIRNLTLEASVSATLMNPIFIVAGLASGTLVVGTSASLQTSNNLTLLSDANGSARIGTSEGTITGNATVQRCIPAFPSPGPTNSFGRRWRFVSSPIQNATFLDWRNEVFITGPGTGNTVGTFNSNGFDATMNNNASIFRYNEFVLNNRDSGWVSIKHIDTSIVPGIGYRLFVRGDRSDTNRIGLQSGSTPQNQVTLNLIGPVNQGNVTMPVSFTSSGSIDEDGWSLLGNPYPSPINWDAIHDAGRIPAGAGFTGTNYNHLEANIWVFNPITANYDTYNALSDLGNISGGIVASGQSFWVKATDISPGLLCREVHKTAGGNGLFKTEPEQFHITLIYDSTNQDKLIVGYIDGSTTDYDAYDAADIVTPLSVSAYGKDKKKLAISSRPQVTDKDTIWLNVNAYQKTENKLVFNNMNTGRLLVLVDTYTGTSAPISEGFVYTFQVTDDAATRGDKRFYIVSEFSTTSIDDASLLNPVSDDIQLYPNPADNRFYIKHTSNKNIQSVVIRNTEGKEVWKSSAEFVFKNGIDISDLTDGMYWVETIINQQSVYTKLVIIH
jgi:fibronectin-binding autotransporter adhesin